MCCRQDLTTAIRVSFVTKALSLRHLLVSEMLCDNICFMLTPSSLLEWLERSQLLSDQSRHLSPDWFRETILPVNHRCANRTVTFLFGVVSKSSLHLRSLLPTVKSNLANLSIFTVKSKNSKKKTKILPSW